ncbi:MAG TPA: hypothetical protein VJI46_06270 [Candidatus Nanoarchaeia archaeon]|nr:hypothetical protein [Candidatus Nanoarchaeia archaeon]
MEYANIAHIAEPEDPPEIVGSSMLLIKHRDPLHAIHVRTDNNHLLREISWHFYMTSRDFWETGEPDDFRKIEEEEYGSGEEYAAEEYKPMIEESGEADGEEEAEEHGIEIKIENLVSESAPASSPIKDEILESIKNLGDLLMYDVSFLLKQAKASEKKG